MRIRKFRKEDAEKVAYLIRRALTEVNSKDYPRYIIRNLVKNHSPSRLIEGSKKRQMFVAEERGRILGTASLGRDALFTVFVNPSHHGKGIGTALMHHLEKIAKKKGKKTLKIPSSITAYGFYRKLGYKKIRTVTYEECGKIVMMKKKL